MERKSQLLYLPPTGTAPQTLLVSRDRIPILWLFCFGARNTANPGESAVAAKQALGDPDQLTTKIEDAQFRLDQVRGTLEGAQEYWPWISALPVLRARLNSCARAGHLQLHAPWAMSTAEERAVLRRSLAFLENAVNLLSIGRADAVQSGLGGLEPISPFVPYGDGGDWTRLTSVLPAGESPVRHLATLTVGAPDRPGDTFVDSACTSISHYEAALAKAVAKPRKPAPEPAAPAPQAPASGGIMGKLGSLFGRKK